METQTKTYTIELTEPMIHILAHTYFNRPIDDFMDEVINTEGDRMIDRLESEGNIGWYEDEYERFFQDILDLQKQNQIW